MRKLTSKEERKKQKRNQVLVGIVLIGVLVISVFGIFVNSFGQSQGGETGTVEYNGYQFINQNQLWYTQISQTQFAFSYNPLEINEMIENSPVSFEGEINKLNSYSEKPLYIYSGDYKSEAGFYRNLGGAVLRTQNACPGKSITEKYPELKNIECEEQWPVKTCEENFIIIKSYGNETSESRNPEIIQDNNCLIIQGEEGEEITKLSEHAILDIVGIE